jgi:preprotein translocase subunit SecY
VRTTSNWVDLPGPYLLKYCYFWTNWTHVSRYFSKIYKYLTIDQNFILHTASKSRNNFHSPFFDVFLFLLLVTLVSWQFSSFKLALTLNPTHLASILQSEKHFIAATSAEPTTLWLDKISSGGKGGPPVLKIRKHSEI